MGNSWLTLLFEEKHFGIMESYCKYITKKKFTRINIFKKNMKKSFIFGVTGQDGAIFQNFVKKKLCCTWC